MKHRHWSLVAHRANLALHTVASVSLRRSGSTQPGSPTTTTTETARCWTTVLSDEVAWRGDAAFSIAPSLLVNIGGDAQLLSGRHTRRRALNDRPEFTTLSDYRGRDHARSAYAEAVAHVSARATFTAGARFDDSGLTGAAVASPWALIDLDVTSRTSIRVGSGLLSAVRHLRTGERHSQRRRRLLPQTARLWTLA